MQLPLMQRLTEIGFAVALADHNRNDDLLQLRHDDNITPDSVTTEDDATLTLITDHLAGLRIPTEGKGRFGFLVALRTVESALFYHVTSASHEQDKEYPCHLE